MTPSNGANTISVSYSYYKVKFVGGLLYLGEALTHAHRDLTAMVSRSNFELVSGAVQAPNLAAQTAELPQDVGEIEGRQHI